VPFDVEIVAPHKKVEKKAEKVILPGVEGDLGVLSGHAPLITALRSGKITVVGENFREYYKVDSGVLQVRPGGVSIVAGNFEEVDPGAEA
jgi:F-type H+-transporting ATPase subunit epsilon